MGKENRSTTGEYGDLYAMRSSWVSATDAGQPAALTRALMAFENNDQPPDVLNPTRRLEVSNPGSSI
jgi:hypothetical protein